VKRPTRKKLLATIERVRQQRLYTTCEFVVEFEDENGRFEWWNAKVLYSVDDLLLLLMEKSMFYRIVGIRWDILRRPLGLTCIKIRLAPDKNNMTNIDCEFIEAISKWNMDMTSGIEFDGIGG
jgi:hypothetical protein